MRFVFYLSKRIAYWFPFIYKRHSYRDEWTILWWVLLFKTMQEGLSLGSNLKSSTAYNFCLNVPLSEWMFIWVENFAFNDN